MFFEWYTSHPLIRPRPYLSPPLYEKEKEKEKGSNPIR